MKTYLYVFLLLYIYTSFSGSIYSQKLYLEIKGKDSLETKQIKALNYTDSFDTFNALNRELDSVKNQLFKNGYIAVEQIAFSKITDTSYQSVFHLNEQFKKVKIFNTGILKTFGITKRNIEAIATEVSEDHLILDFVNIEASLQYLNLKLSETGDPFITLQLTSIKPSTEETNLLETTLKIETQKKRYVTDIKIRGYEKFPKAFLTYSLGIKKGIVFQKQKIIDKTELLDNLGFVKNIKAPEVLFTEDKTELYLYLEKVPNNLFDGIIGFATNEETNNLEFNGYINLALNNNLNFGESLLLEYKNDGNEQEHFKINTELPYLFQSPVGLELGLDFFKRDSTFLTVEKQALANYRFDPRTKVYAGYKDYESTYLLDEQIAGIDVSDYESKFLVLGATYAISQRSSIFPFKTFINLSSEIGSRKKGTMDTGQYRLHLRANHSFSLNDVNSIFLSNQTGYLSSENYLTNELFRFGGINSIRGFDENSIDASLFSVINTEYRYLLSQNTYIHSITDIAYFENKNTDIKSSIYSFGLGFGLQTNAGLLKLNIANGTLEGQDFKFSNTKIHISLNTKF